MAKVLTDAAVRRLKAGRERRIIRDGGARSLYLIVQPSGAKSWGMRFRRPGGKAAKIVLGPVDLSGSEVTGEPTIGMPLTLSAARQVAAQVHRERSRGVDVAADHKVQKHRRRDAIAERGSNSFGALARQFVAEHARPKTRHWRETSRLLGLDPDANDLAPTPGGLALRWADRDSRSIDGHDIHGAVDEARRIGVPGIEARRDGASEARARSLHAALSVCFGWLLRHRRVDVNPCVGVFRPRPPSSRDRVLTNAEVVKFWHATDVVGLQFAAVLKLLLLTGCRLNEVAGLRLEEISEDASALYLPGSRTKNHRAHVVPLAPMARSIIADQPRIDGCAFIFSTNGKTPISGWSKTKARLDAAMDIPPWRLHDLRRTAVTGMAELGVRPDVIEAAVNHVSGTRAGVAGTYNRSTLLEERRAALERWAAHVAGLVAGGPANVTPIRRRRGET
jgi:integrase